MLRSICQGINGRDIPVYLYEGVWLGNAEGKAAFQQELAGKLQKLDPQAHWDEVTVRDPEDKPVSWKVINANLDQDFFPQGHGQKDRKKLHGYFQLWWFDEANGAVLFGSRAADDTATANNYRTLAKLTAGTLRTRLPEDKPANAPPAEVPWGRARC